MILRMQNVYISCGGPIKYAISTKWVLAVLESILTSFGLLFGCLGESKMRKSRSQEGIQKSVDFRDPFFSDFGWFGVLWKVSNLRPVWPFCAPFSILAANFSARGSFLAILKDFGVSGPIFFWLLTSSWHCCLRTPLHFVKHDSGRNRQESVKILAETAKILISFFTHISAKESSGVRRSSRMRTQSAALRREWWRG